MERVSIRPGGATLLKKDKQQSSWRRDKKANIYTALNESQALFYVPFVCKVILTVILWGGFYSYPHCPDEETRYHAVK